MSDYIRIQQALAAAEHHYPIPPHNHQASSNNTRHYDKRPPTPTRSRSSSVETGLLKGTAGQPTPPPSAGSSSIIAPSLRPNNDVSNKSTTDLSLDLPDIPSFFFDSDSTDLAKTLGAHLSISVPHGSSSDCSRVDSIATRKASKASELLASSLRQSALIDFPEPPPPKWRTAGAGAGGLPTSMSTPDFSVVDNDDDNDDDVPTDRASVQELQAELKEANAKIADLNRNLTKLKVNIKKKAK